MSVPPKRFPLLLMVLMGAFVLTAASWYLRDLFHTGKLAPGTFQHYNVLLITLDTLRADRLPVYGYTGVKTPHLDEFAKESFVFEDAYAHVPLTLPSHTCMLTGRLPIAHGVRDNAGFFLDEKEKTLAEVLKDQGYTTSAFISAFVLDSRWKINQGFDLYWDNFNLSEFQDLNPRDIQRKAEETSIEVEHWLEANREKRFFTWVHFYDPHDPYDPPEPYRSAYASQPYDGEIAYTDEHVGRILQKLEDTGLKDRTIVIITGDHGEGLGEHNEMTHAMFIYRTTQHVPLLIRIPGAGNKRIKGIVRHIDLMPTVLELLGISVPAAVQGQSLIPMMKGKKEKPLEAYSESRYAELHYGWSPLESITTEQYRYIHAPKPELYDYIQDPGETRNLIQEKASIAKVLRDRLQEMMALYASKETQGPQRMDPDTEEKLRALGYIGATAVATEESRKIDPKDKIHLARAMHEAFTALQTKRYKEALYRIEPVLAEDPNMIDAHFIAGVAYTGTGQLDKGADELFKTLRFRPDHTMALFNLGYVYELKKDLPQAERWYKKVLQYEQNHLFATVKLGHIYRQMNQPEKARGFFLQAIRGYSEALEATRSDKARSALFSTLGELHFAAGDLPEAEENYKYAVQLTPARHGLFYSLAQIYEIKGQYGLAAEAYQREIQNDSANYKAWNNLGIIYKQVNRLQDAAFCFQKVVELLPNDPRGYLLLASTYRSMGKNQEAGDVLRLAQERHLVTNKN